MRFAHDHASNHASRKLWLFRYESKVKTDNWEYQSRCKLIINSLNAILIVTVMRIKLYDVELYNI